MVLITAVGLVAAMGFLSVLDLGGLQQSMEIGFERLGADLLVVDRTAKVNLTQALLAVEPDTPALPMEVRRPQRNCRRPSFEPSTRSAR